MTCYPLAGEDDLPIDFLAVGHLTQDRVDDRFCPGGTVSYAAVTARRLGRHPGILTRGLVPGLVAGQTQVIAEASGSAYEPLVGVDVHLLASDASTIFNNIYDGKGRRVQVVEAVADPIQASDLPPSWADVPLVLLGPVARELTPDWAGAFPAALVGMTAQGWLRQWDAGGRVSSVRWEDAELFLRRVDVLVLSRDDVQGDESQIAGLARLARTLVVTAGRDGCTVYLAGTGHSVPSRPACEVDPTGAGDVFAAAFLIRLAETGDPLRSARFANVVASRSVEGPGMSAIPWREQLTEAE